MSGVYQSPGLEYQPWALISNSFGVKKTRLPAGGVLSLAALLSLDDAEIRDHAGVLAWVEKSLLGAGVAVDCAGKVRRTWRRRPWTTRQSNWSVNLGN